MEPEKIFNLLYIKINCPGCKKRLMVTLTNAAMKYGFVCPNSKCKTVTSSDSMWILVLEDEYREVN